MRTCRPACMTMYHTPGMWRSKTERVVRAHISQGRVRRRPRAFSAKICRLTVRRTYLWPAKDSFRLTPGGKNRPIKSDDYNNGHRVIGWGMTQIGVRVKMQQGVGIMRQRHNIIPLLPFPYCWALTKLVDGLTTPNVCYHCFGRYVGVLKGVNILVLVRGGP